MKNAEMAIDRSREQLPPELEHDDERSQRLPRSTRGPLQFKGGNDLKGEQAHAIAASGMEGGGGSLPYFDAIQRSFGKHDVGGVSAHVGGAASQAANQLGAVGYASGNSVAFANTPDLHLAAHEAAHVVQQRGGVRLSDGTGQAGDEYERHADEVADRVVRGESAEELLDQYAHRGSAGGSAVQLQRHGHGHGHGHGHEHGGGGARTPQTTGGGGGSSSVPARPVGDRRAAAHVLVEPDTTQILASFRDMISRTARSYGAEGFPSQAFNNISNQLAAIISQHRAGMINDQEQTVSAGTYTYRFRLHGSVRHGPPTDVRQQHGRGTMTTGAQDTTGYEGRGQDTTGSQDQTQVGGGRTTTPGDQGGVGTSASGQYQHTSSQEHQTGSTAGASHQGTEGTSMGGRMEHIEYVQQVIVSLEGTCEVVHDAWSLMGRAFGTSSTDSTNFATGEQTIGETPGAQQGASH